jgi:hypothetical protein
MIQLNAWSSTILVIFFVVCALVQIGLIGLVVYLILWLNRLLTEYQQKIDPILIKADHALTIIADKADSIGGKAESLLAQSEEVAESVHEKVDRTAIAVQKTINAPIIGANSLVAGFTRGLLTFARLQRKETAAAIPVGLQNFDGAEEAADSNSLLAPLSPSQPIEDTEIGAEKRNASALSASEKAETSLNPVPYSPAEPVGRT